MIEIYFGSSWKKILADTSYWWNLYDEHGLQSFTGILGDPKRFNPDYQETLEMRTEINTNSQVLDALNSWVINLAKVGFYLTVEYEYNIKPPVQVSNRN